MHNNGKHRVIRTVVPLLSAVLLALWSTPAYSQAPFTRPTVTRAIDLIENYPARVPIGTDVVFKRKTVNTGRALVQSGAQVRIFTLGENENRPQRIATIADCDVYLSIVHRLEPAVDLKDLELRFVKMDQGWDPTDQQSKFNERWALVFSVRAGTSRSTTRTVSDQVHRCQGLL